MKRALRGVVDIIRPVNCIMAALAVPASVIVLAGWPALADPQITLAASFVAFMVCAAGNTLNDYFDLRVDKINRPNRPLPSGLLKKRHALLLSVLMFLSGIYVSATLSEEIFAITLAGSAMLAIYDAYSKKAGFVGNIAVSLSVSMPMIAVGFLTNSVAMSLYISIPAFLVNLSRELVKAVEDMKGDSRVSRNSFPLRHGVSKTAKLASLLLLLGSVLLAGLYTFYGPVYLVLLLPALYMFSGLATGTEKLKISTASRLSKNIKIGIALSILALLVTGVTAQS